MADKEIALKQNSPEAMITLALEKGASIEVMERMFAMREKFLAEQAKAAYNSALAEFQSVVPVIKKTKRVMNKDGKTVRYIYAPTDSIISQIQKPLAKAGLTYRWETKQVDNKITAICFVTHVLGHTESSDFTVEIDKEAFMNAPQKAASALTFAKRYSLTNALGIATGDEDTDATDVGKEAEPKSPKSKIIFLLKNLQEKTGTKPEIAEAVRRLAGVELEEKNYPEIIKKLEARVIQKNADEPTIE